MAETIGQHQISAFTSPVNGDPLDANVSRGNDNTIRNAYVDHDADPGIHVQSSALASRPAANSLGRKWMSVDGSAVRLFYDTGTTWSELTAQAGTLLGATLASNVLASSLTSVGTLSSLTVSGDLTVDTSTLKVDSANNRVGVGTASPLGKAHINDGTNRNVIITTDATQLGTTGMCIGAFNDGATNYVPLVTLGSVLHFATGGVEKMRLDASGNLGIGTASPGFRTTIQHNFPATFTNAAGDYAFMVQDDAPENWLGVAGQTTTDKWVGLITNGSPAPSLVFGTGGSERMRIDTGGSLGLGVTPSAWPTASYAVLELPIGGHIITDKNGNNLELGANFYINSSFQAIYKANGAAASYNQDSGVHKWSTAPSGTAGNVATLTERMRIKLTGQVRFVPLAADPSGAEAGDVYYNSSSNKLKVYNGTSWVDLH